MSKVVVGQVMPDFSFSTDRHFENRLSEVVKKADKTVLWVLRYIGCPPCQYDVHCIAENYARFQEKNAQVYVVMQSSRESVQTALSQTPIPFEIICDETQSIYESFSIEATQTREERLPKTEEGKLMLEKKLARVKEGGFVHGSYEGNEQQLPAMFIVDKNRVVLYAHYAKDMIDMPEVDQVLELL